MVSTRERILTESLELFAEKGYHGTSMREIAKAVGIKGSSIYNHFKGKEDVFSELFNYLAPLNLKSEEIQAKFKELDFDSVKMLNYFGDIIIKEMHNPKKVKLLKMMIKENNNSVVKKRLQSRMQTNSEVVTAYFTDLQQRGEIKSDLDPEFIANEFISGLIYYRMRYLFFEIDSFEKLKTATQKHISFFWKNIRAD